MASTDPKARIAALKRLLENEEASTQDELREQLEQLDFVVNQSTVSRDLRRLGAIKSTDSEGRTTYRISNESTTMHVKSLTDLVRGVYHNGAMIVVKTDPGSASLIARHIDNLRSDDILGTIAGDDTIFVSPASIKKIASLAAQIEDSLI